MPKAEVYSLAAAAATGKKVPWSQLTGPVALDIGQCWVYSKVRTKTRRGWVYEEPRKEFFIQMIETDKRRGHVTVWMTSVDGEMVTCSETLLRETYREKMDLVSERNRRLQKNVVLRIPDASSALKKGWEIWKENQTSELYIVTGTLEHNGGKVYCCLKGTVESQVSEVMFEEGFTWVSTI